MTPLNAATNTFPMKTKVAPRKWTVPNYSGFLAKSLKAIMQLKQKFCPEVATSTNPRVLTYSKNRWKQAT